MFLIGLNAYGDKQSYFEDYNIVDDYYRMELTDGVFDGLKIDNIKDIEFILEKSDWDYTTLFLAKFHNNLEAGNIDVQGQNVTHIALKRRLVGETVWQNYIQWKYDSTKRFYSFIDKFAASGAMYEYAIVPIAVGGIEGKYAVKQITQEYRHYFLMDQENTYRLSLHAGHGNVTSNRPSAIFLPMESPYPIVAYNSALAYKQGAFSGLFFVEDYCSRFHDYSNYKGMAREYREKFIVFLNNMKPKVLKDESGNMWLINIVENVGLEFQNNTKDVLCKINFQWVETGNSHIIADLKDNALVRSEVMTADS